MKRIEKLEQAGNSQKALCNLGINSTFFYAYTRTLETINEDINFDGIVWDKDVKEIINHCKDFELKSITISNRQAGIEDILMMFEEEGCQIELTKVRTRYIDLKTSKPEIKNAFKIIMP